MLWFKGQQSTIYRSKTTRLFLVKEALTMARQPGSKAGRSSAGKSTLFSALLCLLIMLLRLVVLFKSSALLGVHRDVRTIYLAPPQWWGKATEQTDTCSTATASSCSRPANGSKTKPQTESNHCYSALSPIQPTPLHALLGPNQTSPTKNSTQPKPRPFS
jgi:hypothetical protein